MNANKIIEIENKHTSGVYAKQPLTEQFPAETRATMLAAAAEAGRENRKLGRAESDKSVKVMKEKGLTVHPVTSEMEAEWRQAAEKFYPQIKGKIVPADIFEEVQRLLKEYRATQPSGGA